MPSGVHIPAWLTIILSILLIAFGLYRISLGTRKKQAAATGEARIMGGGMSRMSPQAHLFVGILYVVLGGFLLATSFGFNPLGGLIGPRTEAPSKDAAPGKPVPVEIKPAK